MRKSVIAIAVSAVAMTVSAVDYYFYKNGGGEADLVDASQWFDPQGNHPETLFAPGHDYFLMDKTYWSSGIDFRADTLNLGSPTSSVNSNCTLCGPVGSGFGIADLHVWGAWGIRPSASATELGGKITVESSGGFDFYYDSTFSDRSQLVCPDSGYVYIKNSKASNDGSKVFYRAAGDYSQMRGHWFITGGAPTLVLESPTALGATDSTAEIQGIRVQYANTLRFAVSNGVEFVGHENKVISLRTYNGKTSPVLVLRSLPQFGADDYTVPVAIVKEKSYTDAIVNKVESGRVTLAKKCDADQLNVQGGTLRLARTATLKTTMKVTVSAGAKLSLEKGGNFRVASLTVGDTACAAGVYMKADLPDYLDGDGALQVGCTVPNPLSVTYDSERATATPVDLSEAGYLTKTAWKAVCDPIPVALSTKVALPQLATNRMAVAYLPLSGGFTEEDFTDASEKTDRLPRTWFETEEQGGKTVLYLVVKPVMTANAYKGLLDGVVYEVNSDAEMWSDGLVPHPGADYLNNLYLKDYQDASFMAGEPFHGDSYTMGFSHLMLADASVKMNLRSYSANNQKTRICTKRSGTTTLEGTLYVDSSCTRLPIWPADSKNADVGNQLVINADITGDSTISVSREYSSSMRNDIAFLGDNSGFRGAFDFVGEIRSDRRTMIRVTVTNEVGLGGAMAALDKKGVFFEAFPRLVVDGDCDFSAQNRCWASNNGLQVEVKEDVTCSVGQPYYSSVDTTAALDAMAPNRCAIEKTGAGTLALAKVVPSDAEQNPVAGNGRNDLVRVKEGGLMALAADTFAGCTVAFEDGAAIVVDPANAALAETGMVLDRAPTIAAGAKVKLVPAFAEAPTEDEAEVVFLTVPASTPDLSGVLVPRKVRSASGASMRGTLKKEDKVVGGRNCTVYSATYEVKGLILFIQ